MKSELREQAAPVDVAICPYFHAAVELIGRRWNGLILESLGSGPLRYSDLKSRLVEVSPSMLSQRLRELEAQGLVVREVVAGPPVQVTYLLTEAGRALAPILAAITGWGHTWLRIDGPDRHDDQHEHEKEGEL